MSRERASAIIVKGNTILLIHRYKPEEEYYVLPGGHVEEGETPEEAIIREIREETGLQTTRIPQLLFYTNHDGNTDVIHPVFACQVQVGELVFQGEEALSDPVNDRFQPEWVGLSLLASLIIYPLFVRQKLLEMYGQ